MSNNNHPAPQRPGRPEPEGPALPIGTRIALYYIFVFLILSFGSSVGLVLVAGPEFLQAVAAGEAQIDPRLVISIRVVLTPLVVAMTIVYVRRVDRKPLAAIGAGWPGEGIGGGRQVLLAVGGAAALLAAWVVVAAVGLDFHLGPDSEVPGDPAAGPAAGGLWQVALFALGLLVVAALDEWIFRGYIYSALRERLSWVHAGGVTALFLSFLTVAGPDLVPAGLVNGFLIGLILAAIRELTGNLWAGAIFHGTWNVLLGSVLSLPVSGIRSPRLFEVRVTGAEGWSGGEYGPEGSWPLTAVLLAAVVSLAWVLSRRGEEAQ